MSKFADLHCHPHMRSFNWFRGTKVERKKTKFHPWHIVYSKIKAKEKGKRASAYSQSDLIKLHNGDTKLAFVALYPLEKGWVKGKGSIDDNTYRKIVGSVKNSLAKFLLNINKEKIKDILIGIGDDKGKKLAFRDIAQSIYMKLPTKRIQYIQSESYNYFDEMKREREFLLTKNNVKTKSDIYIQPLTKIFKSKKKLEKKYPNEFKAEGTYEIAKSGKDLQRIIESDNKTAFVFTIEGSNVFNTNDHIENIKKRIKEVKGWMDTPLFFISLSHHFNNYLCGHAHSIPDIGTLLIDQTQGMNEGINAHGLEIIRYFLNLDSNNKIISEENGRRILIDVKHMSAKARKAYYDEIVGKARMNNDFIPIIASHCAYAGVETLEELIQKADLEIDKDAVSTIEKPFNTWNINLSAEDVLEIFKSEGIIGMNLDQRILAIPAKDKYRQYPDDYDINYLWENIRAMMDVVIDSNKIDLPPKENVVKLFGLGSDFDGYIDPMDSYPTALEFGDLRDDLIKAISNDPNKQKYLFNISAEELVDNICYQNAFDFTVKNFEPSNLPDPMLA